MLSRIAAQVALPCRSRGRMAIAGSSISLVIGCVCRRGHAGYPVRATAIPGGELFAVFGDSLMSLEFWTMTSDRQPPVAGALQPRAVRRAMDAMHANVGHRWTIRELAVIAGTSGRTLQRQ